MVLVLVAVAVGLVAYINPFAEDEEEEEDNPWFYQVAMEDIVEIDITNEGERSSFYRTEEGTWSFSDPDGIPPSITRWGGITLLLSGPQTRRDLSVIAPVIDDPAEYGLDDPATVVNVTLSGDRHLEFRLGDTTTDGDHHYSQVIGFPQLYLIASSWGDVLARLANEPPLPKWYVRRTPDSIEELAIYLGDPAVANVDWVQWSVSPFTRFVPTFTIGSTAITSPSSRGKSPLRRSCLLTKLGTCGSWCISLPIPCPTKHSTVAKP